MPVEAAKEYQMTSCEPLAECLVEGRGECQISSMTWELVSARTEYANTEYLPFVDSECQQARGQFKCTCLVRDILSSLVPRKGLPCSVTLNTSID